MGSISSCSGSSSERLCNTCWAPVMGGLSVWWVPGVGAWLGGLTLGGGGASLDRDWCGSLGWANDFSTKLFNCSLPSWDAWIMAGFWNLVCPCLGLGGGVADQ